MDIFDLAANGHIMTKNTANVKRAHRRFGEKFDGTMAGIEAVVKDMLRQGKQKSYTKSVISTLRTDFRKTHPGWKDPLYMPQNKSYVENIYRKLEKMAHGKNIIITDGAGKVVNMETNGPDGCEFEQLYVPVEPRAKFLPTEKLEKLANHVQSYIEKVVRDDMFDEAEILKIEASAPRELIRVFLSQIYFYKSM